MPLSPVVCGVYSSSSSSDDSPDFSALIMSMSSLRSLATTVPLVPVPSMSTMSSSSISYCFISLAAALETLRFGISCIESSKAAGFRSLTSLSRTLPSAPEPLTLVMSSPLSRQNCCALGEAFTFVFLGPSASCFRSLTEILSLLAVPLNPTGTTMPLASANSSAALLAKREVFFSFGFSESFFGRKPLEASRVTAASRSRGLAFTSSSMMSERVCAEVAMSAV